MGKYHSGTQSPTLSDMGKYHSGTQSPTLSDMGKYHSGTQSHLHYLTWENIIQEHKVTYTI